jgi:hypothetical protein
MNPNAAPYVPVALQPAQAPAQAAAPAAAAPAPPPAAPPPGAVIAYANNFAAKHTMAALSATSAVDVGRIRGDRVSYSTVFRTAYLEGVVLADADGKGAGNYSLSIACHRITPADFKLAERTGRGWRAIATPMFFCKVCYRVAIPAAGGQTVTLTHIETDF